jgi:3-keto-L-gulonate-6-phosphate decarboxylase
MKLQISFDIPNIEKVIGIAQKVQSYADIFEIGTLLLYKYGIQAVQLFRETFEKKPLVVDTKIIDQGKESVLLFAQYNLNWLTLMAGTQKDTIHAACSAADTSKIKIMLDLLDSNAAGQSAMEAKQIGIESLLVTRPFDEKEMPAFVEKWEMIRGNTDLPLFITGKINRDNIQEILNLRPDGIVIGSSITKAEDPVCEAQFFYEQIQEQERSTSF